MPTERDAAMLAAMAASLPPGSEGAANMQATDGQVYQARRLPDDSIALTRDGRTATFRTDIEAIHWACAGGWPGTRARDTEDAPTF